MNINLKNIKFNFNFGVWFKLLWFILGVIFTYFLFHLGLNVFGCGSIIFDVYLLLKFIFEIGDGLPHFVQWFVFVCCEAIVFTSICALQYLDIYENKSIPLFGKRQDNEVFFALTTFFSGVAALCIYIGGKDEIKSCWHHIKQKLKGNNEY